MVKKKILLKYQKKIFDYFGQPSPKKLSCFLGASYGITQREDFSLPHPNVNSEVRQVPLALQSWHWGTWLPPCWHGGLKLHSVHFADKFSSAWQAWLQRTCLQYAACAVSTQRHPSSCLSTPLLASSDWCTQTWCTLNWVDEVLPHFRRTSAKVSQISYHCQVLTFSQRSGFHAEPHRLWKGFFRH